MNSKKGMVGRTRMDRSLLIENISKLPESINATMKMLVPSDRTGKKYDKSEVDKKVDLGKLKKISDIVANNSNAAMDLKQITPYITQGELIWTTLLLYPNGLQKEIISYDTNSSPIKNSNLHQQLLQRLKQYYLNDYKIEEMLPSIIKQSLFGSGSKPYIYVSRSTIDHLINGNQVTGMESYQEEQLKTELTKQFVKDTKSGEWLAKNVGWISSPNEVNAVTGIEALFSPMQKDFGTEFKIGFNDDENDVLNISITDNPALLRLPSLESVRRNSVLRKIDGNEDITSIINKSIGSNTKDDPSKNPPQSKSKTKIMTQKDLEDFNNAIYPNRDYQPMEFQRIKNEESFDNKVPGIPLTLTPPSEAVILCHYNGDLGKNAGAIVLLDSEGAFLRTADDENFYHQSRPDKGDSITNKDGAGSTNAIINNIRLAQSGKPCTMDMSDFASLGRRLLEERFIAAVASNRSESISVTIEEEVLKLMLSRMFKHQRTRAIYVPPECLTYFAFEYNKLGLGVSFVQSAKLFIARLAAMDLADALANIEAATPHNLLEIVPGENDPDPWASAAIVKEKWYSANPTVHDIFRGHSLTVADITDALKAQSLTVKVVNAENPLIAAADITFSQMEKNTFKPVDEASRQNVLNSIANTFGLKKGWLDTSDSGNNFQVEALAEEELLRNKTILYQNKLSEDLADMIRKHTRLNSYLLEELVKIIVDAKEDLLKPDTGDSIKDMSRPQKVKLILEDFLQNVYVSLPSPSTTESTSKLKDKIDVIDELATKWIEISGSANMMSKLIEAAGIDSTELSFDEIKDTLKSIYLIKLFKLYNIPMPFDEIMEDGKEGGVASLMTEIDLKQINLSKFIVRYADSKVKVTQGLIKDIKKADDKLSKTKEPDEQPSELGTDDEITNELEKSEGGGEAAFLEDSDVSGGSVNQGDDNDDDEVNGGTPNSDEGGTNPEVEDLNSDNGKETFI